MSGQPFQEDESARSVFAGRIDILYTLGRNYLSLPFAALCIPIKLLSTGGAVRLPPFIPLALLIAVAVVAERLAHAYKERPEGSDPHYWARRFVFVSALAGACWGVGVLFWFAPDSFPAQAYLCLAYMGMTATEFIARSAHRPAYLAHACCSLGPLAVALLLNGGLYDIMSAVLLVCFAAVLYGYCDGMARLLDESIYLKQDNAALVLKLSAEKAEAEAARDAAQASARTKTAFVANISHELRTPLNALLGMTQLLDRAELVQPHRDHVKVMMEAGQGLQTLLEDVIALTRDDGGPAADVDCDAAGAARAVARLLQPRAWEKRLRLTVTASPSLPHVAASPRRVRQALLKLVDNGLKFTDRGGVEIRVEADGECVRFSVIDTGHGVPAEIAPHLFKAFTPGDSSYARRDQGAGLGLAVVQRIAQSLGGAAGFHSEPGQGATFWFTVPIAAVQPLSSDVQADAAVPPPANLRLLLFSAAPDIRAQIAGLLEPFGNTVTQTDNAAEAAARAARNNLDALIVDAAEADTLSAAPGVKTPILALVPAGERVPVSARAILRWPAHTPELYAALASICAPSEQLPLLPAEEKLAAIDATAFAALERSVGTQTLVEILKSYVGTAEEMCRSLAAASQNEDWPEAARLAQDLAGSAGDFGFAAMTMAARNFTRAAREGADTHALRNTAQTVIAEHERVRRALANLYPGLVA